MSILDLLYITKDKLEILVNFFQPGHMVFSAGSNSPGNVYFFSGSSGERKVQGTRRRPGSDSKPSGRAEAPKRERQQAAPPPPKPSSRPPSGGSTRPPSSRPTGGFLPGSGGGGLKIGGLGCILIVLVVVCIGGYLLISGGLSGGDGGGLSVPEFEQDVEYQPPTQESYEVEEPVYVLPTRDAVDLQNLNTPPTGSGSSPGQTWTVMLYQDADDKILERDIYIDLNEAELVGSSDRVNIISQTDRYRGGYTGDGNWTTAKRFLLTSDNDLERIRSQELLDIGEVNMGNPETLIDFATWTIENYPADKYVLILSDHGLGWPGGWTDKDPRGSVPRGLPLGNTIGPAMYLMDIDSALGEIRAQTGIDAFELVGMDACLMGHMEVFTALTPHARHAVASQEVEPSVGWAYAAFLDELVRNPDMDGAELSRHIVDSYIDEDQRIQNPQARADFAGRGLFSPSAEQVISQLEKGITLAAVDLSAIPALMDSLNNFAFSLQDLDQRQVAQARTHAQPFTSIFGNRVPPSYIDLAHFAALLTRETGDPAVREATEEMIQALKVAITAEKSGSNKPGATGISIYFPNSQLYKNPSAGPQSYLRVADRFASVSSWDEFLNYHYTGRPFKVEPGTLSIPDRTVVAPGLGEISVSPVTLSANMAAPETPVLMSADVDGVNIGYIYMFAGYYDQAANSINVTDSDFIQSTDTREVSGVYYPDWGEGPFTLEFEWEPIVFAINDGRQSIPALLQPTTYGAAPEEAVYSVDGIYTYTDGEQRDAIMYFSDGFMNQVFGYDDSGAPREILPQQGDEFTLKEQWLDLDSEGRVVDQVSEVGDTLVFGDQPLTWEVLYAAPGQYIIGYIVEDLDGNRTESYAPVVVE